MITLIGLILLVLLILRWLYLELEVWTIKDIEKHKIVLSGYTENGEGE